MHEDTMKFRIVGSDHFSHGDCVERIDRGCRCCGKADLNEEGVKGAIPRHKSLSEAV